MVRPIALAATLTSMATIGAGAARVQAAPTFSPATKPPSGAAPVPAPCPAGALPDGNACVRLPDEDDNGPEAEAATAGHHDPHGRWIVYDQIPRRPDRSADYDAYKYPISCRAGCVFSGYDLDRADELQRRGRRLRHVGHGGLDLGAPRGTPVTLISLDHQQSDAEVVYVGPLFGTSVVTRHTVREAGALRDYLVLFGHLDAAAPGLASHAGQRVREGETVGFVGDTGSRGLVHLHLEVRRVRDGVDVNRLEPMGLVDSASTVVCDPRNVLVER
jgi:murein DD-endopeptidase MepM/ murein hydrolase activator NlpD